MLYKLMIIGALLMGAVMCEDVTEQEDCCSLEDKKELVFMWHQVWHSSYTDRRVRIIRAVVQDILNKHPGAQELLKAKGIEDLSSPQFRAYAVKVAHAFDMVINMVEEPLVLEEMVEILAEEFGKRSGLKQSYFEIYADSMETVLNKASSCFNMGAWHRCLRRLAHNLAEKVPATQKLCNGVATTTRGDQQRSMISNWLLQMRQLQQPRASRGREGKTTLANEQQQQQQQQQQQSQLSY